MLFNNDKCFDDNGNELHYVATSHRETIEALRNLGFQEIAKDGNRVIFLNETVKMEA